MAIAWAVVQEGYAASLWAGSIAGIAVGILMIVLVSLPLCCGIGKKYGKAIAVLGIVVGIACLFMPWLGAMGSCVPFVDGICDGRCVQCSSTDRENLNSFCQVRSHKEHTL